MGCTNSKSSVVVDHKSMPPSTVILIQEERDVHEKIEDKRKKSSIEFQIVNSGGLSKFNENKSSKGFREKKIKQDHFETEKDNNGVGIASELSEINIMTPSIEAKLKSILLTSSVCNELNPDQINIILKQMKPIKANKGDIIYTKGDTASMFYLVPNACKLIKNNEKWNIDSNGSHFGQLSLLFKGKREETIVVDDATCSLWAIDRLTYQLSCVKGQISNSKKTDDILSNVPLLAPLPKAIVAKVRSALARVTYTDCFIIKQGDIGDSFYIIEKGEVIVREHAGRVSIGEATDDGVEVVRRRDGEYFGEVALMRDEPRNADIVANGTVVCLKLTRKDFLSLLERPLHDYLENNNARRVLRAIELLLPLSDEKIGELVSCLNEMSYEKGEYIVQQGKPGKNFYIIKSGQVRCTRKEDNAAEATEIGNLFPSDYFGEGALLSDKPRRANVIAVDNVRCLVLDREDFNAALGPLREVLEKNFTTRANATSPISSKETLDFSDLQKIKTIGSGSYGTVDLVRHKVTGATYALKRLRKAKVISAGHQLCVKNERDILRACNHPFLVNMISTSKDATCVYMLMEVCLGGELYTLMKETVDKNMNMDQDSDPSCFPEEQFKFYAAVIVSALGYLHNLGIAHRDLKPENLLLASNGYLKLVDFGFAKDLKGAKTYSLCGTPEYTAPEIYKRAGHDCSADYWALAVLMYEMASGMSPFHVDSENSWDSYTEIARYSKCHPHVEFPAVFSPNFSDFMLRLMHPNPFHRLGSRGTQDIKNHPFFEGIDWVKLEAMGITAPYIPPINNITDTSNFINFVIDPHATDVDKAGIDPLNGEWVEGF